MSDIYICVCVCVCVCVYIQTHIHIYISESCPWAGNNWKFHMLYSKKLKIIISKTNLAIIMCFKWSWYAYKSFKQKVKKYSIQNNNCLLGFGGYFCYFCYFYEKYRTKIDSPMADNNWKFNVLYSKSLKIISKTNLTITCPNVL